MLTIDLRMYLHNNITLFLRDLRGILKILQVPIGFKDEKSRLVFSQHVWLKKWYQQYILNVLEAPIHCYDVEIGLLEHAALLKKILTYLAYFSDIVMMWIWDLLKKYRH